MGPCAAVACEVLALRQQDVAGVERDRVRRDFRDVKQAVLAGFGHDGDDVALCDRDDVFVLVHRDDGAAGVCQVRTVLVVAQPVEHVERHVHAGDAGHVGLNADGQVSQEFHGRPGVRRADGDGVAEEEREIVLFGVVGRVREGAALVRFAVHQEAEGARRGELGAVAIELTGSRRDDRIGRADGRRRRGFCLHSCFPPMDSRRPSPL